ncbi:MAG: Nucleoside-diphosphate-sugar epimerase, partial [Marmoricola sp.]|nr:Nucleoside-diphosphate-sugar epimerase [Marmoricola sp.]
MRLVLSGGTGALGRACLGSLRDAGHEVVALVRSPQGVEVATELGVASVRGDVLDLDSLVAAFAGADAVLNLATGMPVGRTASRPGAWRAHDRLRTTGVTHVVEAARRAGVRRVVQESVSTLYAAGGERWLTEQSPIEITPSTEPAAVGESEVLAYADSSHTGVVLRLGTVIGDDPRTRWWLQVVARGRRIGLGHPEDWLHVLHSDDVGSAVLAALHAPSGVLNVGVEPVRREVVLDALARAAGAGRAGYAGPVSRWWMGPRSEADARSLRVSSDHFVAQTGW